MGTKCVCHSAAFVLMFTCCVALHAEAAPKHKGETPPASASTNKPARPELPVPQAPPVDPAECEKLAQKLTEIKTEEKTVKGHGVMLCSEANCLRLSDKFRTYQSTFTLHGDLKAKTVELRHVKEEDGGDKKVGTSTTTYSFYVESGEDTEKLLACFGGKPLKGSVVVQSFVRVPAEDDSHLKFRANVVKLEVVQPVAGGM